MQKRNRNGMIGVYLALGALLFAQASTVAPASPSPAPRPTAGGGGGAAVASPQAMGSPIVRIDGGNPNGLDAVRAPSPSPNQGGGGGGTVVSPNFIFFPAPGNNPDFTSTASPSPGTQR